MKKMVIVYIIDFLATREGVTGGTEEQLMETINHLDKSKIRPILICLQEFQRIPQWEKLSCDKYILHVYSLFSYKSLVSFFRFARFLKKESVDIVQTFFFDSTVFGVLAAKLAGIRNIISCRRDMSFWYDKKILWGLKFVNRLTKKFLVNSNAVKDNLIRTEKVRPKAVDVIPNGVDVELVEVTQPIDLSKEFEGIEKKDSIVGMVANFNRRVKRVDVFLRAAVEVASQRREVKFLILGGGKLETELKELAQELGIWNMVIFGGKKDEVIPYIKSMNIGVLTSDSEGFPNVVLEYMASGIPVVATDGGGTKELIKNGLTGILVPPGDYKGIAEGICSLLLDRNKQISMGQEARRVVREKYSWDVKIKEIEAYYSSIIGN